MSRCATKWSPLADTNWLNCIGNNGHKGPHVFPDGTVFPEGLGPERDDFDELCKEARALVGGDRQRDYGTPTDNLGRIAAMWSPLLGITVTPKQVALCMVALKLAREVNTPKRDNIVDGIGYLLIASEVE